MVGLWEYVQRSIHYRAPKYVEVRSLNLGVVSKLPSLLIFLYIVVYQILYQNRHMVRSYPSGMGRLQLQRPTLDHCNPNDHDCEADFTRVTDLKYCLPHGVDGENVSQARGGELPCQFLDEVQVNPNGFQHHTLMIPTRITTMVQKATGACGPKSAQKCRNVYEFTEADEDSFYVADVERFTLLIESAFTLPPEDLTRTPVTRGASSDFKGYWEVCSNTSLHTGCKWVKIPCLVPGCDGPESDKELPEDTEARKGHNFFGLPNGDVISIGELLHIAGVDLDRDTNTDGESLRSTGIALQVDVDYQNRRPFMWRPWNPSTSEIKYVYRVSKLPFETYKEVREVLQSDGQGRQLRDRHGIFVNVNITGSICYFDFIQLLLILTTGLSLLAGANVAVHTFASTVWRHKEEYKSAHIDLSRSFDQDDKFCMCFPVSQERSVQNWQYYHTHPDEFTKHFRSLDGDTLRCAGDLLMALHRMHSQSDPQFVKNAREKWQAEKDATEKVEAGLDRSDAARSLLVSGP